MARAALGIDPATDADLDVFAVLARLDVLVLFEEDAEVCVGVKLMWVRVWLLGLFELLDFGGPNLEILL